MSEDLFILQQRMNAESHAQAYDGEIFAKTIRMFDMALIMKEFPLADHIEEQIITMMRSDLQRKRRIYELAAKILELKGPAPGS